MTPAFVFPGQGSQAVGMGAQLAESSAIAREVFEEVDDALGHALSRLMFEGPEADLTLTENAQPALMAVSVAVARVLAREAGIDPAVRGRCVAGHSLGEYSAITVVDGFSLADAARLLRRRGQAMQSAVPVGQGGMAALLGLEMDVVAEVVAAARGDDVLEIANDNAPGQIVISGHGAAIDRAIAVAAERGGKRSVRLPVSAPFHCSLMAPAADVMARALAEVEFQPVRLPVVSNIGAEACSDPATLRRNLVDQIAGRVRWRESVLAMKADGVDTLIELGSGKVLTGLARRIDRDLKAIAVQGPGDIETLVKTL